MFLEQHIIMISEDHVKLNVSDDECCVTKCKLKRLEPITAQLAQAMNRK